MLAQGCVQTYSSTNGPRSLKSNNEILQKIQMTFQFRATAFSDLFAAFRDPRRRRWRRSSFRRRRRHRRHVLNVLTTRFGRFSRRDLTFGNLKTLNIFQNFFKN